MGLASILGCLQLDTLTLHQVTLLVVISFQVIDPANKQCIFFTENSITALKVFVDSEIKSSQEILYFFRGKCGCHAQRIKTVYICKRLTLKKYATTRSIAHITIYNKHKHNHHYSCPIPSHPLPQLTHPHIHKITKILKH